MRARKTIELELCGPDCGMAAHPQCVSRWKLNRGRRNRPTSNNVPAAATIIKETNCCQSITANITLKSLCATDDFRNRAGPGLVSPAQDKVNRARDYKDHESFSIAY